MTASAAHAMTTTDRGPYNPVVRTMTTLCDEN